MRKYLMKKLFHSKIPTIFAKKKEIMAEPKKNKRGKYNPQNAIGPKRPYLRPETIIGFDERKRGDFLTDEEAKLLNVQIAKALHKVGINIRGDDRGSSYLSVSKTGVSLHIPGHFSLSRNFNFDDKTMYHVFFEIEDEGARGKGASKEIHRALVPIYERLGVKKIRVDASLDNGGYTWAKYGFRVTRHEAEGYAKWRIRSHEADAQRIVADYFEKNPHATKFPMNLLARQPWGKEAMSKTHWEGTLDLTDPEQKRDFYDYIGYKK